MHRVEDALREHRRTRVGLQPLTFHEESFMAILPELMSFLPGYYGEVSYLRHHAPFLLDTERYRALDLAGQLLCCTARAGTAAPPVGMFLAILATHPHSQGAPCAFADGWYLHPTYRQGWSAARFYHFLERSVAARGVLHLIITTTLEKDMAPFYTRMGLTPIEWVYYKHLGQGERT
jgi:GNAT superfamily N-acetyltransferase